MIVSLIRWGLALVWALALLFLVFLTAGCGAAGDGAPDYNVLPDAQPATEPEASRVGWTCVVTRWGAESHIDGLWGINADAWMDRAEGSDIDCTCDGYVVESAADRASAHGECFAAPSSEPAPVAAPAPAPEPRVMYVAPDATMLPFVEQAITRMFDRTGLLIEIREDGVKVRVAAADFEHQGFAVSDSPCNFDSCNGSNARIFVRPDVLPYASFAANVLDHEITHVVSGWGKCSSEADDAGHLPQGTILSNGNKGYADMKWTDADTRLACSCGACP